jgi:hypothetical protein
MLVPVAPHDAPLLKADRLSPSSAATPPSDMEQPVVMLTEIDVLLGWQGFGGAPRTHPCTLVLHWRMPGVHEHPVQFVPPFSPWLSTVP